MMRTQVPKHLPGSRKGKTGGSKGNVKGGATARGTMYKDGCVRVIEGEEIRGDDPVEYLLPAVVGSTSLVPEE